MREPGPIDPSAIRDTSALWKGLDDGQRVVAQFIAGRQAKLGIMIAAWYPKARYGSDLLKRQGFKNLIEKAEKLQDSYAAMFVAVTEQGSHDVDGATIVQAEDTFTSLHAVEESLRALFPDIPPPTPPTPPSQP